MEHSYIIAVPKGQKKRTLGYLKTNWINFEENDSLGGFFDIRFPGIDEDTFRNIVIKLKQQGVTIIGADNYLTEKKIMKLADLLNEQQDPTDNAGDIIESLKSLLQTWETKDYNSPEERYQEYYLDIEELVTDFEEEFTLNKPDLSDLNEQKIRNKIKIKIKRLLQ